MTNNIFRARNRLTSTFEGFVSLLERVGWSIDIDNEAFRGKVPKSENCSQSGAKFSVLGLEIHRSTSEQTTEPDNSYSEP
jgi:hypothetical protein